MLVAVALVALAPLGAQESNLHKERVTFPHGNLTLVGFLFRPNGPGPFPAIIWNHGSEKNPGTSPEFDAVAQAFVPAGFVVFAPMRRGHGLSEGPYIGDTLARERQAHGPAVANRVMVQEMETNQLEDQLAGLAYLKALPYVDTNRLGVVGCSYGGIETLLAAERGAGFKAAVAVSPAAESWDGNPELRARLGNAVRKITMPVFIIHPAKDASLSPGKELSAVQEKLGKPHEFKIFPATGPVAEQRHCFGGAQGTHVWAPDAIAFLKKYLD
jgi:carboxymethylenebutenolidase